MTLDQMRKIGFFYALPEILELIEEAGGGVPGDLVAADITDSTALGRSVLTAASKSVATAAVLPTGTNGQVIKHNGTAWVAGTDEGTTYPVATPSEDGLMSSEDKTKLDGVEDNANNFALPSGTDGQILKHNGTDWVAGEESGGLPSGSNGQFLKHNGSDWIGSGLPMATLSGQGTVQAGADVADATDEASAVVQLNALLVSLRSAGIIQSPPV